MYLKTAVKVPNVQGKITSRTKGNATYVDYEYQRGYDKDRQYTLVKRKTIGKLSPDDPTMMYPNENFVRLFPEVVIPETEDRSARSCCLRIGNWIVIRKIIREYKLHEILEHHLPAKDVGLLLDLAAYSIVEEDNRSQHYPSYAYNHPLFSEGMRIYSDSRVSAFLKEMDEGTSAAFLNEWNSERDHRQKIYFSYDSTNKKSQAGDLRIVETGHSKDGGETAIFNYSVAFDTKNREPLFYELYPGSINDMSQLQCMIDRAHGFGYRQIGFILDRGYFSKENIDYICSIEYSFVMMLKGKAELVKDWVLENKGSFETNRLYNIPSYDVYGKTVEKRLFLTDKKPRYIHLYHSISKEADERMEVEKKIKQLTDYLNRQINQYKDFGAGI